MASPIPLRLPTNIDRRKCGRVVPMRVLVLGLGRTGTDSIRKALIHLGFVDTYHGYAAGVENPRDCGIWLEAMRAKFDGIGKPYGRAEFDCVLGHCQAVCDIPAACFAEELIQAYPEAKVILSNRNVDDWYKSVQTTLLENIFSPWASFVDTLAWMTRSPNRSTRGMFIRAWTDYFGGDFEKHGKSVFHRHYTVVREMSGGRHLDYHVGEGWEPLCKFLGVDVPNIPFPNGNDKEETVRRIRESVLGEVHRLCKIFFLLLGVVILYLLLRIWPER